MSEFLVTQSEKFLKKIQSKPVIAESIEDFDSFIEIYSYLKDNLHKLQNIRNKMEIRGFTSPYSALKRYGKGNSNGGDIIPDDVYDQSRHAQYFHIKATNKKNILDQVKSAIASHKIAIGHLEEYAEIKCKKCGQKYKKNSIENILKYDDENIEVTGYECECGSSDLEFSSNTTGLRRLELIKYLPLGGEYLLKRSQLTNYSLEAYRKIIKVMRQEKRGRVKSVTVIAKIKDEKTGKWSSKKVNIDYADESNYELELRKRYGSNVRIELLQFHHKKPSLINDKYVQNALAIAYLHYSENIVNKEINSIIPQFINTEKINKYMQITEEARKDASRLAREADERIELEEELTYIKLKKENLINKDHVLDRQLQEDIKKEAEIKKHFYIETPKTLILWDIFRYYLTTSENRRNNYAGPFPNLRPVLDSNQIKVFEKPFAKDVVQLLIDNGENIDVIPNMKETIQYKMELENKRKKLHMKSNQAACGAVALNKKSNISLNHAADLLYVDREEANSEKAALRKIEKPSTNKAKKFLEIINK